MKHASLKKFSRFIFSLAFLSSTHGAIADNTNNATTPTAVGYWQTIDDITNQPRSIVKLCQLKNNMLYGRIIQVNYAAGEAPTDICNLCAQGDPRYNQPILGSLFLTDMQEYGNNLLIWENGKVLDPHNGKVYDAKVTVAPDGKTLKMRGYIGISLLGRTQVWQNISNKQLQTLLGTVKTATPNGYSITTTGKFVPTQYDSCAMVQKEYDAMSNQATSQ